MVKLPEYEVLNFCFDNDNGCSLTVLANDERFHVTVDPKQLQDRSKEGKVIQRRYRRLLKRAKAADQDGEEQEETTQSGNEDDSDQDSEKQDSAVDVSSPETEQKPEDEDGSSKHTNALHRRILTPLSEHILSKPSGSKPTVQDWYYSPIHYYNLSTSSGKLQVQENQSPPKSLTERMNEILIPTISLPKKTLNLSIPQFSASDLTVLSCASDPAPYHPILVSHNDNNETYFLKPVDPTQPGPTIREIDIMNTIAKKDLHSRDDFRCPQLKGLVYFSSSSSDSSTIEHKHIAAILLSPIADPTPLTRLLDPSTPEHKRKQWAKDAERMVEVLHENGIVWGDAKGDNFMVDKDDKVWIIDFGGSYTEGWVDEKIKETEEGDWQGTGKVLTALEDPVGGTMSEEEEKKLDEEKEEDEIEEDEELEEEEQTPMKSSPRKRSRDSAAEGEDADEAAPPAKQQKRSRQSAGTKDTRDVKYCFCESTSSGRMLACDGKDCKREWFHFECLDIEEAPEEKEWFCEECR
ncbi:unnamed protein product [Zymoseptoria tritici ST99CH_3D7]|uniref:PHD-type domain-containing protein n=1 Tax=Zymoseptoria tritici (strain ST99CH_3D7) TaxID=1276538 RepID=A0A1X7RH06_ZYMT9|nr:unnamed protein product [Zymoseptoria tritici ST99CH_3D7]